MPDYSYVDQPFFVQFLFYPRREFNICPDNAFDLFVDVTEKVKVSTRFYVGNKEWPCILYFHGNGEVVSDYDALSALYLTKRINLIVSDYRGYGGSTGKPDFTSLIDDAHAIYHEVKKVLHDRNCSSKLFVMGRSLGSISAFELAYHYQNEVKGLIIESGFVSLNRLIVHLGIAEANSKLNRIEQECLEMISAIKIPSLVIHGEIDNLVLPEEGRLVYATLASDRKQLLTIHGAGHNDVIVRDIPKYFTALEEFVGYK